MDMVAKCIAYPREDEYDEDLKIGEFYPVRKIDVEGDYCLVDKEGYDQYLNASEVVIFKVGDRFRWKTIKDQRCLVTISKIEKYDNRIMIFYKYYDSGMEPYLYIEDFDKEMTNIEGQPVEKIKIIA